MSSFYSTYGDEMVQAWNNVVGFENMKMHDLDNVSIEEWLANHALDAHLTSDVRESQHSFLILIVENPSGDSTMIISVARGNIYDPTKSEPLSNVNVFDA